MPKCAGKTWKGFVKGKMGPYMRSEGSHGKAMRRLGKEWKQYKNAHKCV